MSNEFLKALLTQLVNFKRYPKYQFERRIDAFIGFFLPAVLEARFGLNVEKMWPEFPVLTDGADLRTTNIDYACYCPKATMVVFVELKTEKSSFKESQIKYYHEAMDRDWDKLIDDIRSVKNGSRQQAKYTTLLKEIEAAQKPGSSRAIYLAPKSTKLKFESLIKKMGRAADWDFLSLEAFSQTDIKTPYPQEWTIVSEKILSACNS